MLDSLVERAANDLLGGLRKKGNAAKADALTAEETQRDVLLVMTAEVARMEPVEVVAATIAVRLLVSEDVVDDDEQLVSRGHDRVANSVPSGVAVENGGQVVAPGVGHGPGRLGQPAPEPAIPLPCPLALSFAGAFVVAGTQPGPAHQMIGVGKLGHVRPEFTEQRPGGDSVDTGNGAEPLDVLLKGS